MDNGMNKLNKSLSTYEREMQKKTYKNRFEKSYREFLLSELILSMMKNDNKSVRSLAAEVGLSPTVIQKIRSGDQEDIKLSNFINISHACGYHLILKKGKHNICM
jgi:DNA-binding Xre family transcriptional regulator